MRKNRLKAFIFSTTFFFPILGPFIVLAIEPDKDIQKLAGQALFFQIFIGSFLICSFILAFIFIGIPLVILLILVTCFITIKGIIWSLEGKAYNFPLIGRWLYVR